MSTLVMTSDDLSRTFRRFAMQFVEAYEMEPWPAIIGMQTRGVHIARRIHAILRDEVGLNLDVGVLDATFYRDDVHTRLKLPDVRATDIPFDLTDRDIILVDDVLYTGRTIRSAMDALLAYGRPRSIRFCCLVDRGHRELPIAADMVGITLPTQPHEEVRVHMKEVEGDDAVYLVRKNAGSDRTAGPDVKGGGA
jgi:pyrimidine operon attenuation protein/uracil phosphoribosyltransferase